MAGDDTRGRRRVRRLGLAVVHGRSMLPTLREGDRLLVLHGGAPRRGGLVVCRLPGGVVAVKRVAARSGDDWVVTSDNPEGSSAVVTGDDVVARVLARVWPRPRPLR
jgi:phage repressor protein C with HTH and peptisase S24 domain